MNFARILPLVAVVSLLLAVTALPPSFAQDKNAGNNRVAREGIEWCDAWLPNATKTDLPYALFDVRGGELRGFNIHLGERAEVRELQESALG